MMVAMAVLGTQVEQMHKTFNFEFLSSWRLGSQHLHANFYPTLKKIGPSVHGSDAVVISWPSPSQSNSSLVNVILAHRM